MKKLKYIHNILFLNQMALVREKSSTPFVHMRNWYMWCMDFFFGGGERERYYENKIKIIIKKQAPKTNSSMRLRLNDTILIRYCCWKQILFFTGLKCVTKEKQSIISTESATSDLWNKLTVKCLWILMKINKMNLF